MNGSLDEAPELRVMVPLAIWNSLNQRCRSQTPYLSFPIPFPLKEEGLSLDVYLDSQGEPEQIGILFMERLGVQSIDEIDESLKYGNLAPKVLESPHFMRGEDTVLVYEDCF